MSKPLSSHPHPGQESSSHQPQAEPGSGIISEKPRRRMPSSTPIVLTNAPPGNGFSPLPDGTALTTLLFASSTFSSSRLDLLHEVGGGGAHLSDLLPYPSLIRPHVSPDASVVPSRQFSSLTAGGNVFSQGKHPFCLRLYLRNFRWSAKLRIAGPRTWRIRGFRTLTGRTLSLVRRLRP